MSEMYLKFPDTDQSAMTNSEHDRYLCQYIVEEVPEKVQVAAWSNYSPRYDKPYYILKPDGEWYCELCKAYATVGHIESAKHKRSVEWFEWHKDGGAEEAGAYTKPWFEKRPEGWFCKLCKKWADDYHIKSDKHQKKEVAELWLVEAGLRLVPEGQLVAATPGTEEEPVKLAPAPPQQSLKPELDESATGRSAAVSQWRIYWSEEHRHYYYHDEESGETTWNRPAVFRRSAAARWLRAGRRTSGMTSSNGNLEDDSDDDFDDDLQ